jgi:PhoPQ-activated pathogenicity-related protein
MVDTPEMFEWTISTDPITYFDRLKELPKFIIVAADDEFMMPDWTNMYWDRL